MLILTEENIKLKGSKYTLPPNILMIFKNIVNNSTPSKENTAYVKAKNVLRDGGVVTMEWLKNMKHYFVKHKDESDPEFNAMGGYDVKAFVDYTLERLTSSYGRAEHTKKVVKPRKNSSNLAGNRSEKSAKSINIVNSIMSDVIPRFESKKIKKTLIITEEQLNKVKSVYK